LSQIEEEPAEGEAAPAEASKAGPRRLVLILAAAGLLLVVVIVSVVALLILRKPKPAVDAHREAPAEFALPAESADQNAARAAALAKAAAEGDLKAAPDAPPTHAEPAAAEPAAKH
jgi:hypothetical protein